MALGVYHFRALSCCERDTDVARSAPLASAVAEQMTAVVTTKAAADYTVHGTTSETHSQQHQSLTTEHAAVQPLYTAVSLPLVPTYVFDQSPMLTRHARVGNA